MLAFLARTPVKIALGDLRRGRRLHRTRTAGAVGLVELALIAASATTAVTLAGGPIWAPLVLALPLLGLELAYDIRSRGRRLVPELAGSTGIAAVAAMIVLADGGAAAPAFGAWAILAARAITSIPHVRDQVRRLHGRGDGAATELLAWDLCAIATVAAAAAVTPAHLGGAMGVAAVVVLQRASVLAPAPTAIVLGIRQSVLGVGVVAATWLGVVVAGGIS